MFRGVTLIFVMCVVMVAGAAAQSSARVKSTAPVNAVTSHAQADIIRIVAGDVDSTSLRVASDISRIMDDSSGLRVIPIVGQGAFINLNDLLTQKTVDIAVVQSDVLSRYPLKNKEDIQYISKLYSEEFHVLARMQFLCLQDLNGRRVSFGPKDSSMAVTAEAVFQAHNIAVEPIYLDFDLALERLKRGELDAVVYVSGKPARAFDHISHKDRVHFLDVGYIAPLEPGYLPSILTAEDYPNLVAPNETVSTIGVSSVMVVLNAQAQSDKFRILSKFSDRFMQGVNTLKQAGYTPKWKEVNLGAPLKGWQRFPSAEKWLLTNVLANKTNNSQLASPQVKAMLQKFVETKHGDDVDQEELFNQFILWYQNQASSDQR